MRYFIIILVAFSLLGASVDDARKANEAYENGQYEKAISLYKKAIDEDPQNAKLYFNLASAQARSGQAQEAIRTFEQFKSMSGDSESKAMTNYNIGNILSQAKKWDQAVNYYKKSLRYIAKDEDAKHNYELAKKKQQEQQKQKKNQDQENKQQKKNQDQKNQKQDQDQQNKKNQQQKKQKQDQNQQQQQQQKQNQQQQEQNQQQQKSKISKAEAEKILKALEQKEKNLLKEFKKRKMESSKRKNEKDW